MAFCLTAFTDDPELAAVLDAAGVDRIGVDLERLGKAERQAGTNSRISDHQIADLRVLRPRLKNARLLARINPPNGGTADEIERVLDFGAEVIMLPYFTVADELSAVARMIDGRATFVPLVETPEALAVIDDMAGIGVADIHFGLNDLRLRMGLARFVEVFDEPAFEAAVTAARGVGLGYAIAGVARADDRSLPIAPDLVYRQLRRLGASGTLISRSFIRPREEWDRVAGDIAALRAILEAPTEEHAR